MSENIDMWEFWLEKRGSPSEALEADYLYYYDGTRFYADITYQSGLPECEFIVDGHKSFFSDWKDYAP